MAKLDDVLTFVKVAQFQSISRAARSLGMPISTVSRRISVLESKLGVSLLRRTTRRVTPTAQGREYFNQCKDPLTLLEEAERILTLGQTTPEGMLRVSVAQLLSECIMVAPEYFPTSRGSQVPRREECLYMPAAC